MLYIVNIIKYKFDFIYCNYICNLSYFCHFFHLYHLLRYILYLFIFLIIIILLDLELLQVKANNLPIEADKNADNFIDRSANNIPIVNIAKPNLGGLSHNKFISYNVNPSGLIIANSSGIYLKGGGFINVNKLTIVAGSSNEDNPHPDNLRFNLKNNNDFLPEIVIPDLGFESGFDTIGLDISNITETDLVANIIKLLSPINAGDNKINLRTGDKEFNYNNII